MTPETDVRRGVAHFGVFEVDLSKGELRREGRRVALQRHSFLVLATLVEHAGEEVSRETLRTLLWPDVEFLDFENGINSAVARLRQALHDSADSPRFVATRRGYGYRLLAPVTWTTAASAREPHAVSLAPASLQADVVGDSPPGASAPVPPRARRSVVVVAAVLAVVLGGFLLVSWLRRPVEKVSAMAGPVSAFPVYAPPGETLTGSFALSPDGRQLVLVVGGDGEGRLWLRSLDGVEEHRLPGTEGAALPFWSPSGKAIGFFAHGHLQTIDLATLRVTTLAAAPRGRGGTWNADGTILFAPHVGSEIWSVSASGGRPVAVTDRGGAASHRFPAFLPDGRHFIFLVLHDDRETNEIWWGKLGSGATGRLVVSSSNAVCTKDHLFFARGGTLLALGFDPSTLRTFGSPVIVSDSIGVYGEEGPTGLGAFSVSAGGVLASADVLRPTVRFTWFDRSGRRLGQAGPAGDYVSFDLSPDDSRVAAARVDPRKRSSDIVTIDLGSGVQTQITDDPWPDASVVWAPTGSRVAFVSLRNGTWTHVVRDTARADDERELGASYYVDTWFPDGVSLLTERLPARPSDGVSLWKVPIEAPGESALVVDGVSAENQARISPDGRWLAYTSDEGPGRQVRLLPLNGGGPSAVLGPGLSPRWRRDGRELFFLAGQHLMSLAIGGPDRLVVGAAQPLFDPPLPPHDSLADFPVQFAVSSDGTRLLFATPADRQQGFPIRITPADALAPLAPRAE